MSTSLSFIVCVVSLVPMVVCFSIFMKFALKTRYKHYLWIGGVSAFVLISFMFAALALWFDSEALLIWSFYLYLPVGFLWMAALDTMASDKVGYSKIVIMTVVAVAVVFTSFLPGSISMVRSAWGDEIQSLSGSFGMMFSFYIVLTKVFLAFYFVRIYRNLPHTMKGLDATLFLVAGLTSVVIFPLNIIASLYLFVPSFPAVVYAILSTLIAIPLIRVPKLAFVLPFKALRLMVVDKESGISLFTYTWKYGENLIGENLFSGIIQGVTMILKESMGGEGDVSEIKMGESVVLIHRDSVQPVVYVLASTKASGTLRDALRQFGSRFGKEYGKCFVSMNDTSQFDSATTLVDECFPFIPEY
jgi:hypothetical protein